MSDVCKIHYNSEHVLWTISCDSIKTQLLGNNKKKKGLLYLNVESAGTIEFIDDTCKISTDNKKLCNKKMNGKLNYKNGSKDSVLTPLSVVNFHTHPLSCYIDAETIWGWPSGEDMSQCLNFANDNNLTHLIFAIEGTYIIDVNQDILKLLQQNDNLFNIINIIHGNYDRF